MTLLADLEAMLPLVTADTEYLVPAMEEAVGWDAERYVALRQALSDAFPMTPFSHIPTSPELIEIAIARVNDSVRPRV